MTGRRTAGSVRKRASGRWQARLRDPATERMVSLGTFTTKAEANNVLPRLRWPTRLVARGLIPAAAPSR